MKQYYVEYKIPTLNPHVLHAGPYKTEAEAEEQADDIRGYEGVVYALPHAVEVEEDLT